MFYFERQYLQLIHYFLTKRWWILKGGVNEEALNDWILVMKVLELDKKARRDLLLLAQFGHVDRSQANKLLWHFLGNHAIGLAYLDVSSLVTHKVYRARKEFDRPLASIRTWLGGGGLATRTRTRGI